MNATERPVEGAGRFPWNAVARFGSSLGASAGMVVVAGHLVPQGDKTLAAIPTLAFAVVLGASVAL